MPRFPAVDSNTLTYLLEALTEDYDPALDHSALVHERVAMIRCYFYGDCSFWVTPTSQFEYAKIKNEAKRKLHDRWTKFMLQDMPLRTPLALLDRRTAELQLHHQGENDCRVVAETEFSGVDTLLSCDKDLIARLRNHARVRILRPSEFWTSLGIGPGAQPVVQPARDNPLADRSWWRLEQPAQHLTVG